MTNNKTITIYTDGSCLGNPGPGGWAALIMGNGDETEIKGNTKDTTNNRMEMMAVIRALEHIRKVEDPKTLPNLQINFFIDSNLIVQTLNSGWKKKKNTDLWAEIEKLSAWLNIKWNWVKAHHDDRDNNRVDELAFAEAKKAKG